MYYLSIFGKIIPLWRIKKKKISIVYDRNLISNNSLAYLWEYRKTKRYSIGEGITIKDFGPNTQNSGLVVGSYLGVERKVRDPDIIIISHKVRYLVRLFDNDNIVDVSEDDVYELNKDYVEDTVIIEKSVTDMRTTIDRYCTKFCISECSSDCPLNKYKNYAEDKSGK